MSGTLEIIMMHRVMPEALDTDNPYHKICVTTQQLEQYLEARKDWRPLHLNHMLDGSIPEGKNYAITFDDGYMDNKTHALPLLEKYEVPATIFCGIDFIDGTLEPFEILLDKLLKQTAMSYEERHQEYSNLFRSFKKGSLKHRLHKLALLAKRMNVEPPTIDNSDFMRWDDVRKLDQHPLIEIGSHAVSHSVLWKVSPVFIWQELKKSYDFIAEQLGREVSLLSYPYGRHNFFTRYLSLFCGYKLGFITDPGSIKNIGSNRFRLPRNELNQEFLAHHV